MLRLFQARKSGNLKAWGEPGRDKDELGWLLCTNRQPHEQRSLMLTQIIAGDSLAALGAKVHEVRKLWGIKQACICVLENSGDKKTDNTNSDNKLESDQDGLSKSQSELVERLSELPDLAKSNGITTVSFTFNVRYVIIKIFASNASC